MRLFNLCWRISEAMPPRAPNCNARALLRANSLKRTRPVERFWSSALSAFLLRRTEAYREVREDLMDGFEYRGWVRIEVIGKGERFSAHAHLRLKGEQRCLLVLATSREDHAAASAALGAKARDYIDDWTSRPHTGTTGFTPLLRPCRV